MFTEEWDSLDWEVSLESRAWKVMCFEMSGAFPSCLFFFVCVPAYFMKPLFNSVVVRSCVETSSLGRKKAA